MAESAILDGHVGSQTDAYLQDKFSDLLGAVPNNGKDAKGKVLNQWRATLLTDDSTTAELKARAEKAAADKKAAEVKRIALEAAHIAQAAIADQGGKVISCDGKVINGCKEVISEDELLAGGVGCVWWRCSRNKKCKRAFCGTCAVQFAHVHQNSIH